MDYFAYGSNMSLRRLQARTPSARLIGTAVLPGHELRFHKCSQRDGSAKCDAFETGDANDCIHGVVYTIDDCEKPTLDACEGLGAGYELKTVEVMLTDGALCQVMTYYATLIDSHLKPYHWYKQHVLTGAREHGLPDHYITRIESVTAIDDPDPERHQLESRVYLGSPTPNPE